MLGSGLAGLGSARAGTAPARVRIMDTRGDPPPACYECQANKFARLTASDTADNWLGWSVSISGDVAQSAACLDDKGVSSSGSPSQTCQSPALREGRGPA